MYLQDILVNVMIGTIFFTLLCVFHSCVNGLVTKVATRYYTIAAISAGLSICIIGTLFVMALTEYNPQLVDSNEIYINRLIDKNQRDRDKRVEELRKEHLKNGLLFSDI